MAQEGRKVGSLKRRVRSHVGQMMDTSKSQNVQNTPGPGPLLEVAMSKKCTPLWREAHFQVKMRKTHNVRTTFGSCDVEKVHAVAGAKHISKSKAQKTAGYGAFLDVQMCFLAWQAQGIVDLVKSERVLSHFQKR